MTTAARPGGQPDLPLRDPAGRPSPSQVPWLALALRAVVVVATSAAALAVAAPIAAAVRLARGRADAARYLAGSAVRTLTRLGPTFVKGGQVLGTRRDLLPAALCDALSTLHDSVPPLTAEQGARELSTVYGAELGQVFTAVDRVPVASGSIACVYRGTLRSGEQVAVKLRRPEISARMAADLALIRHGAALVARLPMFRGIPVRELVDHLCASVLGQLDFDRESTSLDRMRANLRSVARVRVPRRRPDACRPGCIVMDFVPDLDLDTARRCSPAMRRAFAAATLAVMYQMLFIDGFVHCDLHPGNLYFTASGQVVVLDAGFSAQLSERVRRLFAEFFLNMSMGRGVRAARVVIESSLGVRPGADVDSFTTAVADLVVRSSGAAAKDFSLMAFATELFDLQRRYGISAAPEFVFPLLSLLVVEGTIRDLDPEVDFQAAARPVLMRAVFQR